MAKKKPIKTRDHLMVKVINGATKAGVQKDKKKEENKKAAREKVEEEEPMCMQCYFPLTGEPGETEDFCSKTCEDYFNEQYS